MDTAHSVYNLKYFIPKKVTLAFYNGIITLIIISS